MSDHLAPGPFLDRNRAARLMEAAGIDALVITEPEPFIHATGAPQGVPALFRRAGSAFALIPADPTLEAGVVIGDFSEGEFRSKSPITDVRVHPVWIETIDSSEWASTTLSVTELAGRAWSRREPGFHRPATFDIRLALAALKDLLAARGLAKARVGFELEYVSANDLAAISSELASNVIRDGSRVVNQLRMVKAPAEIARLRLGCELGEAGIRAIIAETVRGLDAEEVRQIYRSGVTREAARRGIPGPVSGWEGITVGPDPLRPGGKVENGSIIKVDIGCLIDGYSSDTSRNLVFGEPTQRQIELHDGLQAAFAAGAEVLGPGRPLAAVHRAASAAMHERGFTGYQRGHFGHGLGNSFCSEQWPFISADATVVFEPGMVVAFEIPFTLVGVGAFNLEDQILITDHGHETMNRLPRRLLPAGALQAS